MKKMTRSLYLFLTVTITLPACEKEDLPRWTDTPSLPKITGVTSSSDSTLFRRAMEFAESNFEYCNFEEDSGNIKFLQYDYNWEKWTDRDQDFFPVYKKLDTLAIRAIRSIYHDYRNDTIFLKSHYLQFEFVFWGYGLDKYFRYSYVLDKWL